MEKKICKLCGKEFVPDRKHLSICSDKHFRNCIVCGKEFEVIRKPGQNIADMPKTCSKECANKLRFKNGNPLSDVVPIYI